MANKSPKICGRYITLIAIILMLDINCFLICYSILFYFVFILHFILYFMTEIISKWAFDFFWLSAKLSKIMLIYSSLFMFAEIN